MMPMRRILLEGKRTVREIAEMQDKFTVPLMMEDFTDAIKNTSKSVSQAQLDDYKKWMDEFGSVWKKQLLFEFINMILRLSLTKFFFTLSTTSQQTFKHTLHSIFLFNSLSVEMARSYRVRHGVEVWVSAQSLREVLVAHLLVEFKILRLDAFNSKVD